MEITFKNIGLFFMAVLLLIVWGFYHTIVRLFVGFHTNNIMEYLHQFTFLLWFALCAAQPFLLKYKKAQAQKICRNCTYLLAPLVMFAIYFVAKEQYLQDIAQVTVAEAIARQTMALPNIFAFGALNLLAICSKENIFNYRRYIIAASLLLIGLGLSHAFIVYIQFPFAMGVSLSFIITDLILLTLLVNDKIYGHISKPYLVSLTIILATHLIWFFLQDTSVWQNMAGKFAQMFF